MRLQNEVQINFGLYKALFGVSVEQIQLNAMNDFLSGKDLPDLPGLKFSKEPIMYIFRETPISTSLLVNLRVGM